MLFRSAGVYSDAAGNNGATGASPTLTFDPLAPAAPVLALGNGVAAGATAAKASQTSGVITLTAEAGASVAVSFSRGANTVLKTVTGNGATAVPVSLASADLSSLGDGVISVSAIATDAAGNASGAATTSFTLDTVAPAVTISAIGGSDSIVTTQAKIGRAHV